ncbi:hypothetical protein GF322_02990 [Candidatus Dependentiae bacterium]|nr:hypothetical protein [Candidatus Dependentiae bacterium]
MEKNNKNIWKALFALILLAGTLLFAAGCSKKDERTAVGAGLGAATGAGIGAAAGGGEGAAIGGVSGGLLGGIIGRSTAKDKKK